MNKHSRTELKALITQLETIETKLEELVAESQADLDALEEDSDRHSELETTVDDLSEGGRSVQEAISALTAI